jgi:hypothetical protein
MRELPATYVTMIYTSNLNWSPEETLGQRNSNLPYKYSVSQSFTHLQPMEFPEETSDVNNTSCM